MRFLDRLSGCAQRENDREPAGRIWMTGFYKQPVEGAVWLGRLGLEGDGHADLEHHGGYEKAVLAYSNCPLSFLEKDLRNGSCIRWIRRKFHDRRIGRELGLYWRCLSRRR